MSPKDTNRATLQRPSASIRQHCGELRKGSKRRNLKWLARCLTFTAAKSHWELYMMDNSQQNETWTQYGGAPVYWLAPEFWNPKTGIVRLLLPGEEAYRLSLFERQKRTVEFLKLQGDPRYCDKETAARMKRLMVERLGTDTPWRGVPPNDVAAQPDDSLPVPPAAPTEFAQTSNPFA